MVLLSGEPGIGKSRLTAGLLNQLANEPHTRLRYFCSPQHTAPETKAAMERAKLLIERVRALGEPLDDPLPLLSVLYGFWVANYVSFNGNAMRELAVQFLKLAENEGTTGPLIVGHRVMGITLLATGNIVASRTQFTRAIELYDPKEHRSLAALFSRDNRVAVLSYRSWALWYAGYPDAALGDANTQLSTRARFAKLLP